MKRLIKKAINFSGNFTEEQKQSLMDSLKNAVLNGQFVLGAINPMVMTNEVTCTISTDESFDVSSWDFCAAFEQICKNDEAVRNKIKDVYSTFLQQISDEKLQGSGFKMSFEQYSGIFNDTLEDRLKYAYAGIQPGSKIYDGSNTFDFVIYIPSAMSAIK